MEVATWLRTLGLGEYAAAFDANAVDGTVLPDLTDGDLEKLGVVLGHRKKLLKAIAALRATGAPPPASAEGPAERRQLTVMFTDLVGSTALSARLDPEDMREVIRAYQTAVANAVANVDGTVAQFMGDGVLAWFGWPLAHEDDAARAVRAGLAVIQAVPALRTAADAKLEVRVGIATGLVVVGDLMGEGGLKEQGVVGDTPNLAARLQALALPGTVVVAESTRRLLGGLFALDDLGTRELRGIEEPVRTWRVGGEGAETSRFEARQMSGLTALVGRGEELAFLLRRWELARSGEGQVVLLSGEPGIGKSRLVHALRERLDGEPHTVLSHECSPYHTNTALHPVIGLLERATRLHKDDSWERKLDRLEALLGATTDDARSNVAVLADLLAIPTGDRKPSDLDPQQRKEKTLKALLDQLSALAAHEPLLVLYEDVHWIDPTSLELLDLVVERVRELRLLLLLTCRPEFGPRWTGHGHVTALSLSRLGGREGAALVTRVSVKNLPEAVVEQIVAKTDGVPLFIEELTRTVLESGMLADAGDRYVLASGLPSMAIPATLRDALMARLDRVGPAKEIAQVGAVIGREFPHDLIAAVVPMPADDLQRALDDLVAAGLISRHGLAPETGYAFRHALVRDVAYESLLKARRRAVHAAIALRLKGGDARAEPEILAQHAEAGGLPLVAAEACLDAARVAAHRWATAEAVSHAERGLAGLAQVNDGGESGEVASVELRLRELLARMLVLTHGHPDPRTGAAYEGAQRVASRTGDVLAAARTTFGQSAFHLVRGELSQARNLARRMLDAADGRPEVEPRAVAQRVLGTTLFLMGDAAAAALHLRAALEHAADLERPGLAEAWTFDPAVAAHSYLALVELVMGRFAAADLALRRALERSAAIGHLASTAFVHLHACVFHVMQGNLAGVALHAAGILEHLDNVALTHPMVTGQICRAWAAAENGDATASLDALDRGVAQWRAAGARCWLPLYLGLRSDLAFRLDRREEADCDLAEALAIAYSTGEQHFVAELTRRGAALLAASNRPDEARAQLQRALAIARQQGARLYELRAACDLARLWADRGERAKAADLLAPIHATFTDGFDTPDLVDASTLLDALG